MEEADIWKNRPLMRFMRTLTSEDARAFAIGAQTDPHARLHLSSEVSDQLERSLGLLSKRISRHVDDAISVRSPSRIGRLAARAAQAWPLRIPTGSSTQLSYVRDLAERTAPVPVEAIQEYFGHASHNAARQPFYELQVAYAGFLDEHPRLSGLLAPQIVHNVYGKGYFADERVFHPANDPVAARLAADLTDKDIALLDGISGSWVASSRLRRRIDSRREAGANFVIADGFERLSERLGATFREHGIKLVREPYEGYGYVTDARGERLLENVRVMTRGHGFSFPPETYGASAYLANFLFAHHPRMIDPHIVAEHMGMREPLIREYVHIVNASLEGPDLLWSSRGVGLYVDADEMRRKTGAVSRELFQRMSADVREKMQHLSLDMRMLEGMAEHLGGE